MPTATTTSTRKAKGRGKSAARGAASRGSATSARKASKARASKARGTKAARAKAARTRAVNQTREAVHQAELASRDTGGVFGEYAERAVLIPIGAALTARDRVVASVSDTVSKYSSPAKTQAQLRRFERRGVTARKRLEREVRKARIRVERELRQRRREIERTVGLNGRHDVAKNGGELANRVQERILSLV
jgi:hypothetical protein